jgi:hypothetical protein
MIFSENRFTLFRIMLQLRAWKTCSVRLRRRIATAKAIRLDSPASINNAQGQA